MANLELKSAQDDLQTVTQNSGANEGKEPENAETANDDDSMKDFHMEDYDKEIEEDQRAAISGVKSLAYYENPEDDEYMTKDDEIELKEEQEDLQIMPEDLLLLAAKTEDEVSVVEVYVYESDKQNLYVHHDFMLPSFPLCVEWLETAPPHPNPTGTKESNFVAIGTFEPEIEIWNLDLLDAMVPTAVLGRFDRPEAPKKGTGKKKRKLKQANEEYHVDAILDLASNKLQSNLLASGSADCTIKLWDLNNSDTSKAALSLQNYHTNKVSSLSWNPSESSVLLSGGYDQLAIVGDIRSSNIYKDKRQFKTVSDVENVQWDSDGTHFYVSTERGQIFKFDARQESKPVWMLQAHDAEVSSFAFNQYVPGLMVSGSSDRSVKLWNVSGDKPSMVLTRNLDVGRVFSVNFAPAEDAKSVLSVGGSEGALKIWDVFSNRAVRESFKVSNSEKHSDAVIAANQDDEEEDSDRDMGDEDLE